MNNPVQRLHFVVSTLVRYPTERRASSNERVETSVREAVKKSFELDGDAAILRTVAEILAMPAEAEAALRRSLTGPKLEAHLGWHAPVMNAVDTLANLSTKHTRFVAQIPDGTVKELQLAVFEVPDVTDPDGYGDPQAESVAGAVAELDALAETITNAVMDEELKRFLLDHVDRMRVALREYRIRGGSGVFDATDAALGAIYRATQVHPEWFTPDDDSTSTTRKFFDVVGKVADVGGVMSLGVMSLPWVQAMLPG